MIECGCGRATLASGIVPQCVDFNWGLTHDTGKGLWLLLRDRPARLHHLFHQRRILQEYASLLLFPVRSSDRKRLRCILSLTESSEICFEASGL
jgi:hypothetical protein